MAYNDNGEAVCFDPLKVVSDSGEQSTPYACSSLNDVNTCDYYYSSIGKVSMRCSCALDGTNGYCPIPGLEMTSITTLLS
jgi:hypothetical protein